MTIPVAFVVMMLSLLQAPPPQTTTVPRGTPPRDPALAATTGTAVIRGTVTNAEGHPLRRVQVRLSGASLPDGRTASTNSLGKWELRDVPAGEFTLSASRSGYLSVQYGQQRFGEPARLLTVADGATVERLNFAMTRNGAITGHVFDEAGEPLASANVMTMQMRFFNGRRHLVPTRGNVISDDSGQFRLGGLEPGEYYVFATSRETWETDPPDSKAMGFIPTFYPAATTQTDAQRIRVRAGQEVAGIDFALVPGRTGTISGTASNAQGQPLAGETVSLGVEIRGESFSSFSSSTSTKVNADGTFVLRNVAPGEYHLNVRVAGTADHPAEAANVIVNVPGGDVDNVSITTSAAGGVVGRVVVEPGDPLPVPLTRLTVRALPVDRETSIAVGVPDNGHVREDGSFEVKSILSTNRLTIGPLPPGWALRSIDQNGRDLAAQPFDPRGQMLEGATVVLTHRFPTVTATVTDASNTPLGDAIVVMFPEDAALWTEDLRLVRSGRAAQNGAAVLRTVPPGIYLAVTLQTASTSDLVDPEFLESLRSRARRVVVNENEPTTVPLVLAAGPGR